MLRKTTLLVVLVMAMSAIRVLTCELACPDQTATHQDVACHDDGKAATALVGGTSHHCDYGTMAPALSALQKPTVLQYPAAFFTGPRTGTVLLSATSDVVLILPAGTPPHLFTGRALFLRI